MQVFGSFISVFVRKVRLVAAEKALPSELVLANPHSPLPDFVAASPLGRWAKA